MNSNNSIRDHVQDNHGGADKTESVAPTMHNVLETERPCRNLLFQALRDCAKMELALLCYQDRLEVLRSTVTPARDVPRRVVNPLTYNPDRSKNRFAGRAYYTDLTGVNSTMGVCWRDDIFKNLIVIKLNNKHFYAIDIDSFQPLGIRSREYSIRNLQRHGFRSTLPGEKWETVDNDTRSVAAHWFDGIRRKVINNATLWVVEKNPGPCWDGIVGWKTEGSHFIPLYSSPIPHGVTVNRVSWRKYFVDEIMLKFEFSGTVELKVFKPVLNQSSACARNVAAYFNMDVDFINVTAGDLLRHLPGHVGIIITIENQSTMYYSKGACRNFININLDDDHVTVLRRRVKIPKSLGVYTFFDRALLGQKKKNTKRAGKKKPIVIPEWGKNTKLTWEDARKFSNCEKELDFSEISDNKAWSDESARFFAGAAKTKETFERQRLYCAIIPEGYGNGETTRVLLDSLRRAKGVSAPYMMGLPMAKMVDEKGVEKRIADEAQAIKADNSLIEVAHAIRAHGVCPTMTFKEVVALISVSDNLAYKDLKVLNCDEAKGKTCVVYHGHRKTHKWGLMVNGEPFVGKHCWETGVKMEKKKAPEAKKSNFNNIVENVSKKEFVNEVNPDERLKTVLKHVSANQPVKTGSTVILVDSDKITEITDEVENPHPSDHTERFDIHDFNAPKNIAETEEGKSLIKKCSIVLGNVASSVKAGLLTLGGKARAGVSDFINRRRQNMRQHFAVFVSLAKFYIVSRLWTEAFFAAMKMCDKVENPTHREAIRLFFFIFSGAVLGPFIWYEGKKLYFNGFDYIVRNFRRAALIVRPEEHAGDLVKYVDERNTDIIAKHRGDRPPILGVVEDSDFTLEVVTDLVGKWNHNRVVHGATPWTIMRSPDCMVSLYKAIRYIRNSIFPYFTMLGEQKGSHFSILAIHSIKRVKLPFEARIVSAQNSTMKCDDYHVGVAEVQICTDFVSYDYAEAGPVSGARVDTHFVPFCFEAIESILLTKKVFYNNSEELKLAIAAIDGTSLNAFNIPLISYINGSKYMASMILMTRVNGQLAFLMN